MCNLFAKSILRNCFSKCYLMSGDLRLRVEAFKENS